MAIGNGSDSFKTRSSKFSQGYGLLLCLDAELPRKFDEASMGGANGKGFIVDGTVKAILGALAANTAPALGDKVKVTIRPGDSNKAVFDDMSKTNEGTNFLLEGVTGDVDNLEARWVHGAGANRDVRFLEIVGVPHISFDNPIPKDGPRNGLLRLNLDGSPTKFDVRLADGTWSHRDLSFDVVVERLKTAMERNASFRVTQRVLEPSMSLAVDGQSALERLLTQFRHEGYTSCVVRTFVPGTTDPNLVDTQVLSWPEDIAANGDRAATVYEMPVIRETKKFAQLRDGDAVAVMELIPGYEIGLVNNPSDSTKSAKHIFVNNILAKGLSDGQKNLYAAQSYGPGYSIRAVNDDGVVLGLTRLATRSEGTQYSGLMTIPSPSFPEADKIVFPEKSKPVDEAESLDEAAAIPA